MSDTDKILAESQSQEVVQAATMHAEAIERARLAQMTAVMQETAVSIAKETAFSTLAEAAEKAKKIIADAAETATQLIKNVPGRTGIDVISNDISYIKRDIGDIKEKLERNYVSKDEFTPVRNIVYGLVGILGVATVGAILKLILKV